MESVLASETVQANAPLCPLMIDVGVAEKAAMVGVVPVVTGVPVLPPEQLAAATVTVATRATRIE
jgi:hypothetical protein